MSVTIHIIIEDEPIGQHNRTGPEPLVVVAAVVVNVSELRRLSRVCLYLDFEWEGSSDERRMERESPPARQIDSAPFGEPFSLGGAGRIKRTE